MSLIVNAVVLGLLLGVMFAFNCRVFRGKSYWTLNLFIGVVTMGMTMLLDRLLPGVGFIVAFALGILASTTVTKLM